MISNLNAIAQDSVSIGFQVNVLKGNILPHSADIKALSYSSPHGFSATLLRQNSRSGKSERYPIKSRNGLKMQFVNFNNSKQLGSAFSISGFTEPLMGSNRKLFISAPIEFGFVYVSKIYHPTTNPENLFFSTPISFYLNAGLHLNFKLGKQTILNAGMQYQHISNGGIKMPNKGMNFITMNTGICYYLQAPNWQKNKPITSKKLQTKYLFESYLIGSAKTLTETNELKPIIGFQVSYLKPIALFHHWMLSTEGVYHTFNKAYFARRGEEINPWMQSVLGGYALRIGNTSFQVLLGLPVINKTSNEKLLYQRYALVQTIKERFLLTMSLKAEGHVADIFDLRLGYRITR